VHAFVPVDQCGDGVGQNLKEHLSVGQIVKCRIKSIMREKKAMLATFRINDPVNTDLSGIKIGELTKGKIMRVKEDIIVLSLDPSQVRANLHISHLSDHLSPLHLAKVVKALKQDDTLKNLLVLSKNEDKGFVNVSCKHLLVEAAKAGKLPKTLKEVEIGAVVPGYVRNVTDYAAIADHYVASPVGVFFPNQSVICRVISIDTENSRCEVSLKSSDIDIATLSFITEGDFIKSYFSELYENKHLPTKDQKIRIGHEDENTKIKASINEDHARDREEVKEGAILYGVVLDFDEKGKFADLSVRPDLMDESKRTNDQKINGPGSNSEPLLSHRKELRKLLKNGETVDAVVELVKEDYIIVSLPKQGNTIAFATSKSYNDRSQPFTRYKFGQKAKAKIVHVPRHKEDAGSTSKHGSINRVLVTLQFPTEQQEWLLVTDAKTLKDFSPGQKIKGTVTAVEKYGVFIKINDTAISGLCHISKVSDDFVRDLSALYKVGQRVTAVILEVDLKTQKISFGLKESCFRAHNLELSSDSEVEEDVMELDEEMSNKPRETNSQLHDTGEESDYSESEDNVMSASEDDDSDQAEPLSLSGTWKWGDENEKVEDQNKKAVDHSPD
ncbi:17038_t:CDS:2, partial [Acaulospora colombiana]